MTNEELLAAINRRFDENNRRWEEVAEFRRHVDVRFEAVDGRLEQLWEAIGLVDDKLERFRKETKQDFEVVNQRLGVLETRR